MTFESVSLPELTLRENFAPKSDLPSVRREAVLKSDRVRVRVRVSGSRGATRTSFREGTAYVLGLDIDYHH